MLFIPLLVICHRWARSHPRLYYLLCSSLLAVVSQDGLVLPTNTILSASPPRSIISFCHPLYALLQGFSAVIFALYVMVLYCFICSTERLRIGAGDRRGGIGLFGPENCERRACMRLGDYTLESLPTTTITICRRRHL